jgi:spore maturation protein SpmA
VNAIFFAIVSVAFLVTAYHQIGWIPPAPDAVSPMDALGASMVEAAGGAVTLAIGLVGIMSLFLGLMKVAEAGGMLTIIAKTVRPLMVRAFPDVPPNHPAMGAMILNISANALGLGNAATPFGIKAMEELQKLNPTEDTATNPMVMLLAINTASVQLVPPVLLLALMGLQINQLIFAIIITTGLSLVIAITGAKLYGRLPAFRDTDPNRNPPPAGPTVATPAA